MGCVNLFFEIYRSFFEALRDEAAPAARLCGEGGAQLCVEARVRVGQQENVYFAGENIALPNRARLCGKRKDVVTVFKYHRVKSAHSLKPLNLYDAQYTYFPNRD
jgi:hypothetical protein